MSGDSGASSSVETQMRVYYSHCLRPLIEALENRLDDFFGFTGTQRKIEFDVDGLFRAELGHRVEALTKAVQGGLMTPNEARALERLAPVEGGDSAFLQRQMVPVDLISQLSATELANAQAPAEEPEDNDSEEDVARNILQFVRKDDANDMESDIVKQLLSEVRKNG
jgi:hypothetical protein